MYINGFGNTHQSEAVAGTLPLTQNSPQQCAQGLYAEQLSGTSFTRARHLNLHSWLYRSLPSVAQGAFERYEQQIIQSLSTEQEPNPLRWSPLTNHSAPACDFINGLVHLASTPLVNAYLYQCSQSMDRRYFASNDGEMLFVPYEGEINLCTEFGLLTVLPGMIAVIPRGVKFKVEVIGDSAKGYIAENSGAPLTLPQLGPLGANGLANPRHFQYPVAAYECESTESTIIVKYQHKLWRSNCDHSPLNVVAWHGNYAPYRYDLSLFNTVNTVSFDHPDPSIFTVLTSESETPGVANLDFVIFPPRWMVAEHTFRPPYFHRNYMNELMGLIRGQYDAKKQGFAPGGVSIHNYMIPHGPDFASYEMAANKQLKPEFIDSLAFMFETKDVWHVTDSALKLPGFQTDYVACWQGFINRFEA